MRKLMIKKMEKTWEVPLLKDKLGGVNLCAKVYGETFYAPTFKDGKALNGCIETPLMFTKDGERYRVYTVDSKFPSGSIISVNRVWWNRTSQDLKAVLNIPVGQTQPEGEINEDVIIPKDAIIIIDVIGGIVEIRNLTIGEKISSLMPPFGARFGASLFIKRP